MILNRKAYLPLWEKTTSYQGTAFLWVVLGTYIVASGGAVGHLLKKGNYAQVELNRLQEKNSALAKINQRYEIVFQNTSGNVKLAKDAIMISNEAVEKLMKKPI